MTDYCRHNDLNFINGEPGIMCIDCGNKWRDLEKFRKEVNLIKLKYAKRMIDVTLNCQLMVKKRQSEDPDSERICSVRQIRDSINTIFRQVEE